MAKKGKYYQRKDGLFETIKTINGKRVAFRGKTCREVDRKILEYKEAKDKGRTVSALIDSWEADKERSVSVSTWRCYQSNLGDIREYFDGKYVSDVKPIDCVRMLEHMAAQGYKSGTVSIRKSMLKQIFRFAVIHGDIDVSPAAEVTLPRHLPKNTRDSLTAEQIDAVLKFRGGDWWLMGIAFLLTGCRRGELMALRYEDIDRKNKTVRINKKYNYATGHAVLENHLKSEAGTRTVPLLPALEEVLPVGRIGLIFHNEKGDPLEEFQINKAWAEYRAALNLPREVTPHWLRHTYATICRDAGVDIKTAAGLLGHSNESLTAAVYTHQSERHERQQLEKLERFVSSM
jgi:integrase